MMKQDREEFFTITQKTLHNNKEVKTETAEVILLNMDGYYVFESGNKIIQINFIG